MNDFVIALSRLLAAQGTKDGIGVEMNKTEKARGARQNAGFASELGECETTGFETRMREDCEEISEIQCKTVNVTQYRTELRPRCKTLFDQTCNVTYAENPANKCSQLEKTKYKNILLRFYI